MSLLSLQQRNIDVSPAMLPSIGIFGRHAKIGKEQSGVCRALIVAPVAVRVLVSNGETPTNRSDHRLILTSKADSDAWGFYQCVCCIDAAAGVSEPVHGAKDGLFLIDRFPSGAGDHVLRTPRQCDR
jgi:hypothetical protein